MTANRSQQENRLNMTTNRVHRRQNRIAHLHSPRIVPAKMVSFANLGIILTAVFPNTKK